MRKSVQLHSQLPGQSRSRRLLVFTFITLVTLSCINSAVLLIHSHQIHEKLNAIVENLNVKLQLINTMHNAARDRSIILFRMTSLKNPFELDESNQEFIYFGGVFSAAREQLMLMSLSADEKQLLQKQADIANRNVPAQRDIASMAMNNQQEQALQRISVEIVPLQRQLIGTLNELEQIQFNAIRQTAELAKQNHLELDTLIYILTCIGFLIVLYIARVIIRRITHSELQVYLEKELAEVTLNSIGDAVITTDTKGHITFMNPVAEELTGWDTENAEGMPLDEVYQIYNEIDHLPASNPVNVVLSKHTVLVSPHNILLKCHDRREFAIEHTAAPIMDTSRKIHGVIVVFRDVTEMRSLSYKLSYQASHDALTGLVNRREFETRLEQAIVHAHHEDKTHALCYMDLDQFKVINDTAGHAAGDELLKQLADRLLPKLRLSDVLARLGGDEFGVLLEGCSESKALEIADNLRETITGTRFFWANNSYEVGVSIGIVLIDSISAGVSKLLADADTACYAAKEKGRNRIQVYHSDDEDLTKRQGEMRWVQDIQRAIDEKKFITYIQDIIPLQQAAPAVMRFYEVLLRIQGDNGKIIPPMSFLPAAERYNLMPNIDRWVIAKSIAILEHISAQTEQTDIRLSVNISGQSLSEKNFLDYVISEIRNSAISPDKLCFEITETAAIANMSRAVNFIKQLKELGCFFALDDFGSGLSSFSYLKNMPVDYLKIDGSFVRDICNDMTDLAFVEAIHRIGKMMSIKTIAEFVENKQTLEKLREIGVDYAQGYYISPPMDTAKL